MTTGEAISRNGRGPQPRGRSEERAHPIPTARGDERALWVVVAVLATLIVGWVGVVVAVEPARFVLLGPRAHVPGIEVAAALAHLFAALVLFLFPDPRTRPCLSWVAGGFLVLGLGWLAFGYLLPVLGRPLGLNASMYASLVVWTVAGALFAVGLLRQTPQRPSRRAALTVLAVVGALGLAVVAGAERLPVLADAAGREVARGGPAALPGLTGWHWALSLVPLALAGAAAGGAVRHLPAGGMRPWLVVAMVLLAGSQMHNLFWPAAYRPVLTTGNLLRLAFGAVVAVGGVLELRRVAAERAALLAAERESARRLAELAVLRADFTAMVAHELGSPLAAIRFSAELLATGPLDLGQADAVATIEAETDVLAGLVADVRAAAAIERDDFAVRPRPVPVGALLADEAVYARALPGDHAVTTEVAADGRVRADPVRIGQVLRTLVANAAKYSPPGSPVRLRARPAGDRVRIEVVDQGQGIHPDDLARVFEKFGRGRDERGRNVPGMGLGLYLSRRIVRAHGAELTVASTPGAGSVFGFELEVAP